MLKHLWSFFSSFFLVLPSHTHIPKRNRYSTRKRTFFLFFASTSLSTDRYKRKICTASSLLFFTSFFFFFFGVRVVRSVCHDDGGAKERGRAQITQKRNQQRTREKRGTSEKSWHSVLSGPTLYRCITVYLCVSLYLCLWMTFCGNPFSFLLVVRVILLSRMGTQTAVTQLPIVVLCVVDASLQRGVEERKRTVGVEWRVWSQMPSLYAPFLHSLIGCSSIRDDFSCACCVLSFFFFPLDSSFSLADFSATFWVVEIRRKNCLSLCFIHLFSGWFTTLMCVRPSKKKNAVQGSTRGRQEKTPQHQKLSFSGVGLRRKKRRF